MKHQWRIALTFAFLGVALPGCVAFGQDEFEIGARPVSVADALNQIADFKRAIKNRDCAAIVTMTRFPFRVNSVSKGTRVLEGSAVFCTEFDAIFDKRISDLVLRQEPATMGAGSRGLKFGNGEVWLQSFCTSSERRGQCIDGRYSLKLVAVNLP